MHVITLAWVFGAVWGTAVGGAPLTVFAETLGATPFQFGLLGALPFAASLLSLPASALIDRTGERKRIFLTSLYVQRGLWIAIALLPVLVFSAGWAWGATILFLVLIGVMHCGQAVGGPAWMSWMADVVPRKVRGVYFSRRRQWGILSAIPAAVLAGWVLDLGRDTGSATITLWTCAGIFVVAALFGIIDIALFHLVPHEKPAPTTPTSPTSPATATATKRAASWGAVFSPLKDRQFVIFCGLNATLMFAVAGMGQFVTLFVVQEMAATGLTVQLMLLVLPMLGQLLVLPLCGRVCDRMGKKPTLAIGMAGMIPVGLGWCVLASRPDIGLWLGFVLAAAMALFWAGVEVANFNYVLEMAGTAKGASKRPDAGSRFVAVHSVIVNIAGCLGGVSFGLVASRLEGWSWDAGEAGGWLSWLGQVDAFVVLFAASVLFRFVALGVFVPLLKEERARPTREAVRFVVTNLYSNLQTAALQPARLLRVRPSETFRSARRVARIWPF